MTAMTAATLDSLSGGRFRLGLGVSGPQVSEGWYGVKFDKPLARTREYVEIVRKAMTRERLSLRGRALDPAAARRPRQADQAHRAPAARAHPALHRRHRPEEPGADRRDRRRRPADLPLRRPPGGHRDQAPARGPREGRARPWTASTSARPCRSPSATTRTSAASPTRSARTPRCTSAAWAAASRTSTTSSPSAWATRRRPPRSRTSTCPATSRAPPPPYRTS